MEIEKKALMPTLRAMRVGDVVSYPSERLDTVRVTVSRLNIMRRAYGHRWSVKTSGCVVEVTRKS